MLNTRAAVGARDDLLKNLSIERGKREQLEEDITELLESGFVAEMTQKHEELEASASFVVSAPKSLSTSCEPRGNEK